MINEIYIFCMRNLRTTFVSLSVMFLALFSGCQNDVLKVPETPCMNVPESEVLTGEEVVFRVCSDADLYTLWPGDEGHEYVNYGQDNGFSFSTDTFVYVYDTPGTYNGAIVSINQNSGNTETSVKEFVITVTESSAEFDYFAYEKVFPPLTGDMNGDSIFFTVPFKTDLTDMVMTFDAGFAEVFVGDSIQESGVTSNDFSSPVTYKVISYNGENSSEYIVKVNKIAPKSENELLDFGFAEIDDSTSIDHEKGIINVTVPFDAVLTNVVAEFTVSESAIVKVNGTIQESGKTSNNFLRTVQYSIIAEDGSTNVYQVVINRRLNPKNNFLGFAFTKPSLIFGEIDNDNRTIVIEVPEGTDLTSMKPMIETSKGSTAYVGDEKQVSGRTVVNFTNTVYYTVKAQNGDLALYTVIVKFI